MIPVDPKLRATGEIPMGPRLADIEPRALASATHEEALEELVSRALALGVTDPIVPQVRPSEVWLAVHQLAHYARTGEPPEGRIELVGEYQLSAATYRDHVREGGQTQAALDEVLDASVARLAIAEGHDVRHRHLAALASLTPVQLTRLSAAGDAPRGTPEGRERLYDAEEARAWLSGRGVAGL